MVDVREYKPRTQPGVKRLPREQPKLTLLTIRSLLGKREGGSVEAPLATQEGNMRFMA